MKFDTIQILALARRLKKAKYSNKALKIACIKLNKQSTQVV